MSGEVWVSSVMSNYSIGNNQGAREKFFGRQWAPPTHVIAPEPEDVMNAHRRHKQGVRLSREKMTEAMFIFDEERWKRVGDLFMAGPFYAAKGRLAELLQTFDLGDGGLIEFPIFQADKRTPLPGPFYLLNFGCQKDTFLPEQSRGVKLWFSVEDAGFELWQDNLALEDDDIAVGPSARSGCDLWFEKRLHERIFTSGRLHDAIVAADLNVDFKFTKARTIG